MRDLIEEHIAEASTQRTVPMLAETTDPEPVRAKTHVATADVTQRVSAEAAARPRPDVNPSPAVAQPRTGSAEPIQPIPVKTITVRPRSIQSAALGPLVAPAPQANVAPQWAAGASAPAAVSPAPPPTVEAAAVAPAPAPSPRVASAPPSEPAPLPPPPGARPGILGTLPAQAVAALSEPPVPASAPATPPAAAGGRAGHTPGRGRAANRHAAQRMDDPARRLRRRGGGQAAPALGAEHGARPARKGGRIHRAGGEGVEGALSGALCRI